MEWFLARFFRPKDVILDPFMGSGTTLVQANEMNMHAIGVEISPFNCLIARVKTAKYDIAKACFEILDIEKRTTLFSNALLGSASNDLSLFPEERGGFCREELAALKECLLRECQSEYLHTWFAPRAIGDVVLSSTYS
ncbi:DNA methyltransferase [Chthonomonas calidirosea]|uniref:DNA methyltransferase n=1 Tax=Chthonomonas calidirosea TaxID=454171 RepID=UPI003CCE08D5